MSPNRGWVIVPLVLMLAWGAPVAGQAGGGAPEARELSRQQMMDQIQRQFEERLVRELELGPAQEEAFVTVLSEFRQARAELFPLRMRLLQEAREFPVAQGSEDRARALIFQLRQLREREARILVQEEDRLLEILEPSQLLRLQTLRTQFGDRIRTLRTDEPPGPPGPRGPGGITPRGGPPR